MQTQTDFADLPEEAEPAHMGVDSADCVDWMLDYMYDHYEDFKLLICSSDSTSYKNFIHRMVEVEVEYTFRCIEVLKGLGQTVPEIGQELCHMIASGMFDGIFETLRHDMPKERAKRFAAQPMPLS